MYKNLFAITFGAILFNFLTACSSQNTHHRIETAPISEESEQSLMAFYRQWQQTPYSLGGTTLQGIDCSGFVLTAYRQVYHYSLPRTTEQQSKVGRKINYTQRQTGDLVFFNTGKRTRHVGIYLDHNRFMHASTSKGVIISRLDSPYWADAFWQIRRVQ